MKKMFTAFLGIPVIFSFIYSLLRRYVLDEYFNALTFCDSVIITALIKYVAILLLEFILYWLIYKAVLVFLKRNKGIFCSFSEEYMNRGEILKKITNSWFPLIMSISLLFILAYITSVYLASPIFNDFSPYNALVSFLFFLEYGVIAFFEEFIFRKLLCDYCSEKKIKYPFFWSVFLFSLVHLKPSVTIILAAIIQVWIWKKYRSLFLNTFLHLLYNWLVSCIPFFI